MPASTKDSGGPSPAQTPSATSGPATPSLGRNSRPSTRRSTPVSTPGTTTIPKAQPNPPDPSEGDYLPPILSQLKPSYRDYDENATPNLSTQNMHPLGEMPSTKAIEAAKRLASQGQGKKKLKGKAANGNGVSGAAAAAIRPGQADKAKTTTPSAAPVSSDISARTSGSPSAQAPTRTAPPNPWFDGGAPSSKTPQGRQRLSMVVEAAVHRSKITGNIDMGRAIKKLYEESLTDPGLASLLDAVLAQRSTPEQFQQFQNYVRTARANPETLDFPITNQNRIIEIKIEGGQRRGYDMSGLGGMVAKKGGTGSAAAISSGTMNESSGAVAVTVEPSNPPTLQLPASVLDPSKQLKFPSYDELKQDSHIRLSPSRPTTPARTRGRKRARSRSPSQNMDQPSPAPAAVGGSTPPATLSATQIPTLVQHPKKKPKTNKTKVSPVKKAVALDNTVVTAGIGELPDHRRARYGSEEVSENEDVCAVCNGAGRFLCCERCPRSFHFSCLDPPLEDIPDGDWFCNKCQAQTNPPLKEPRGIFSSLVDNINRQNPTSFRLPVTVRNYFSGVETGPLGEYVDTRDAKTQKFSKSGFPEEYDTYKLRDKQGIPLLCHDCGKSAVDGQQIISCDYCPLHWHLDCIRPMPMPNPPSGKRKWMCPAHADWVLQRRRPKNAPVVDTNLRRGHRNNGLIEIENEEDQDDSVDFEDITIGGIVYRLPERGIKLDFLDKVKQMNEKANSRKRVAEVRISEEPPKRRRVSEDLAQKVPAATQTVELAASISEDDRNLIDALIELRSQERMDIRASVPMVESGVHALIQSLLKEASPPLISLFPTSKAPDSREQEKQQLLALRDLISARLVEITPNITPTPPAEPSEPEPITLKPKPTKNSQPKRLDPEVIEHHEMGDREFDELMDAEMDGGYNMGEGAGVASASAPVAPMAPMAPMMPIPTMAPVAPMAFMEPASSD